MNFIFTFEACKRPIEELVTTTFCVLCFPEKLITESDSHATSCVTFTSARIAHRKLDYFSGFPNTPRSDSCGWLRLLFSAGESAPSFTELNWEAEI